jgi:hypothetical protein
MFSIPALVAKHIGRRVRLKKEEIPGSNPSLVLAVNLYIAVLSSKLKIRCLCVCLRKNKCVLLGCWPLFIILRWIWNCLCHFVCLDLFPHNKEPVGSLKFKWHALEEMVCWRWKGLWKRHRQKKSIWDIDSTCIFSLCVGRFCILDSTAKNALPQ